MVVQSQTCQHGTLSYLPFRLCKCTCYSHLLPQVTPVADHYVVERVELIFQTCSQRGGCYEQLAQLSGICGSANIRQVLGLAVCVGVLLCSIIAVAVYMLYRRVYRQFMGILTPEQVVVHSTTVYDVPRLLRDVRQERLLVKLVSSAPELVGCMVFYSETAHRCGTIVASQSEGMRIELANLRKAVTIVVVWHTVAV